MAFFNVLEFEESVQVQDKTRLNASKSYIAKTNPALANIEIKPGQDESYISVWSTTEADRYLDWQWESWTFDVGSINNKIDFNEGGSDLVATLTSGTYTLSALLTEIETQLESAGTGAYTLSVDNDDKITIFSTVSFALLVDGDNKDTSILPHIGFSKSDETRAVSKTGLPVEYSHKELKIRVTDATTPVAVSQEKTYFIKVYSEEGDRLFSTDSMLQQHEGDILKWIKRGRSSFKDVHRRAQRIIMDFIYKNGFVDIYQNRLTKFDVKDLLEVQEWSTYMALRLIFEDLSNASDDIFSKKAIYYSDKEIDARNRFIKLDYTKDGVADEDEILRNNIGRIYLR